MNGNFKFANITKSCQLAASQRRSVGDERSGVKLMDTPAASPIAITATQSL